MKAFRIIAVSLFCTMLFSSCQKNYEKLIEGCWQVNVDKSYYNEKGTRHYYGDESIEALFFLIKFENGFIITNNGKNNKSANSTSEDFQQSGGLYDDNDYARKELWNSFDIEEPKITKAFDNGKYHIDKNFLFCQRSTFQISKIDRRTAVLENAEVHIELDRIDSDFFSTVLETNARLGNPIEAAEQAAQLLDQMFNQPQIEIETLSYEEPRQTQPLSIQNTQPVLRWLGRVDLYYIDENNDVDKYHSFPSPTASDFGLYLNQSDGIESYELHLGTAIYHVSIGKFQLSANNGYFEFSAHAGEYYFDI